MAWEKRASREALGCEGTRDSLRLEERFEIAWKPCCLRHGRSAWTVARKRAGRFPCEADGQT